MTTPSHDDPDGARLHELLDSATGSLHARPGLAGRAMDAQRRHRRRLVAVTAVVAALALAGGSAFAVTLTGSRHTPSVLATDKRSPSPAAIPTDFHDVCGVRRSDEQSIVPTGGSPYLSTPAPATGTGIAGDRETALRAARGSGPDLLSNATALLRQVRAPGPKGTCITSVAWVVYAHPDPLSVMNGHVNDTCVAYVLVDAHTMRPGGESVTCTSHPARDCPANAQQLGRGFGGGPREYGELYRSLPTTSGKWTKLPNSPLSTRSQSVVVWTGDKLIVWGGESGPHGATLQGDGAAYNPATRRWTMLPPAPISARASAAAVWTGSEVVIWGGYDDLSPASSLHVTKTGAAYNPSTRTWRTLADGPLTAAHRSGIAWTGSEVIIVDGQPAVTTNTLRGRRQAAAWNPSTNQWRTLPREPAGTPSAFNVAVAHWSNDRLLVFHGYGGSDDPAATTVDSYDPVANRWTHLHKCDGAGYVDAAYDFDGQVLVPPSFDSYAYLYSPQHNTWTPSAAVPLFTYASAPTPDGRLLILTGSLEGRDIRPGDAALWDPRTDSWAKPPRMPVSPDYTMIAVNAGASVLVWTGIDTGQLYAFTP